MRQKEMTMSTFEIWRRRFRTAAKVHEAAAQAPSDLATEIAALRARLTALESSLPATTAALSLRRRVKVTALLLTGAALAGASIVYGQSAVEALFIRQDGNIGIGTNNPASRLTVVGNASIGTEAAAPANGLLVQGDVGIGGVPRAGAKLDVAGAINATAVNVNGTPILADVQNKQASLQQTVTQYGQTLATHDGAIATLTRRNIRGCVVRRTNNSYVQQCNGGEIAVAGGGRCPDRWRLVESYPIDRSVNEASNGGQSTGWRLTCQVWGDAGRWTEPNSIYAMCCPVE
jgi:hypothetical protein